MAPYPVYQPYTQNFQGMINPGIMPPLMAPGNVQMPIEYINTTNQGNISSNTIEQQMNQLQREINNLETRVSKLESSINTISTTNINSNQFTNGNYHIV